MKTPLPPCGLYRTTGPVGSIPEGRLIYFHNHGEPGPGLYLPASWTNQTQMLQAHNRTRLPLFATHARLDCTSCHRNQRPYQYKNTPAECGNCHVSTYLATTNPSHVTAGFSRKCEDCHSVTAAAWSTSVFSHSATFPLSGAHAGPVGPDRTVEYNHRVSREGTP